MLVEVKNANLYREWSDYIKEEDVRDAFWYIIGLAACSSRFSCHIAWKGAVRGFHFREASGEEPFAFITNQRWLLFYFRPPAVRSVRYVKNRLADDFASFMEPQIDIWTVKLHTVSDVKRLAQHIRW